MGVSSSRAIFEHFSTTSMVCICKSRLGIRYVLHILDDFFFMGTNYNSSQTCLVKFFDLCSEMGVPQAQHDHYANPGHYSNGYCVRFTQNGGSFAFKIASFYENMSEGEKLNFVNFNDYHFLDLFRTCYEITKFTKLSGYEIV